MVQFIKLRSLLAVVLALAASQGIDQTPVWAQFGGFGGGGFGGGGFGGGGFGGGRGGFGGGGRGGFGGGGRGGFGGGRGGGGGGGLGGGGGAAAGIMIDAEGVVTPVFMTDKSAKLAKTRMEAVAKEFLAADLNQFSPLRKISLVRLEQECLQYERDKKHVPPDIHFLAGLQRIDYVFVYPDAKDLVIAGPAEGFAADAAGRVVGLTTGRPPLRIDDMIIALQALKQGNTLGCSIDPEEQRLAALNRYVSRNSSAATPAMIKARFAQMAEILGMQNVRVWGVPPDSHFSETLVEADLRMKRISIGLDMPQVRGMTSHLALLKGGGNSMQRWWFTPLYDAFQKSEEGDAFQLAGQRAQLMAQEEFVGKAGQVSDAPFTRVSTQRFAQLFTEKFPDLCEKVPVFAELQSLIDLSIVAALFEKERLPEKAGWEMALFGDPSRTSMVKRPIPKQVPSVMNYKTARRGMILGQVGGGVTIIPMQVIDKIEFKTDEGKRLGGVRSRALPEQVPEKHPWWWD